MYSVLPGLGVAAYFFRRRLKKVFSTCCSAAAKPQPEGKREVRKIP
jgi:hypothetical protein